MGDTERAGELQEKIGTILNEGEFALVLTKNMDGFFVIPSMTALRGRMEGLQPFDSLGPVMLAAQLLELALSGHSHVLSKKLPDAPKIIDPFGRKSVS